MITKLTKKQELVLAQINKEAVDTFYNFGPANEKLIEDSVERLYAYAKLKKPKVEFLDFSKPHLGSESIKAVDSAVGSAVDSAVRSAVGSAVDSAVGSAVRSAVGSAVDSAVGSAVDSAVRSAVGSAVRSAVDSAVDSAVYDYFSWYRWYREDWTVTYWKFMSKIVPNFPIELFEEFRKINEAGYLYYFMFEKVCFVVKMPEKIDQWVGEGFNRRLHSASKEAIDISGLKLYFLNGVQFPKDLWEKVVSGKMPFQEILAIEDIDQRTQAMRYGDVGEFIKHAKGELLDSYQKLNVRGEIINYALYKIPKGDIFVQDAYYMIYDCPSTSKKYMSGVEPFTKVADAMAWKQSDEVHVVTPEEWKQLIPLVHES